MVQQHISSSQFADIMIQRKYDIVMPDTEHPFKDYYTTLLELLQPLEDMNLSPSHYVMILGGLSIQTWKNLYRHIIIKWVQFLQSTESENNYKWTLDWSTLSTLEGYPVVVSAILDSLRSFLTNKNPETVNFRLLFLVNSVQNYFIPV